MKLRAQARRRFIKQRGHPPGDGDQHGDVKHRNRQKGIAPAKLMAKPGSGGNPQQISDRHSGNHSRHRGGDLPRRRNFRQNDRPHAKEGAVRETGDQAPQRQHRIAGR